MGKGFTAVELIVAVFILSILMTAVMPTAGILKSAKDTEAEMVEAAVKLGVSGYQMLYGKLPSSLDEMISSGVILGDSTRKLEYEDGVPVLGWDPDMLESF